MYKAEGDVSDGVRGFRVVVVDRHCGDVREWSPLGWS